MAWAGSGLMMTLLRDVERAREETITLLSGMLARTGQAGAGLPELLCSGSRHGARVLREQLITAGRPGPRLPALVLTARAGL